MQRMKFGKLALLISILVFSLLARSPVTGESPSCLSVYRDGGASAVFQSPKCPRWKPSSFKSYTGGRSHSASTHCQSAMLQGRRKTQEDRMLCVLDLRVPFPGPEGVKEVKVGIMAIFDGHNGAEASEMASGLLLEYFILHTYFLLDTTYSILSRKLIERLPDKGEDIHDFHQIDWHEEICRQILDLGRFKVTSSAIFNGSFPFQLLKEALLRAIHDIDGTFSKDALRYNINSGTTATVVLLADAQVLVANIGDSKAFLCSKVYQSPSQAKATVFRLVRGRRISSASLSGKEYRRLKSLASDGWMFLIAKELTNDHHPDRDDEKSRVESAGGHISEWAGVARVNGQLAVSRAIGDIHFKSYGVISVPEVTDWLPLTANDSYVILASDGVFEKLSPQDICDILWEPLSHFIMPSGYNASCSSLADCIVNTAYERGSMDNLAAVMLPVQALGSLETLTNERIYEAKKFDHLTLGYQRQLYEHSADDNTSLLMKLMPHPEASRFNRLLVEGNHSSGCFYLSENLDVNDDYTFWVHKEEDGSASDARHALTGGDHFLWSGPLDLYNDQHICMQFGMYADEDKVQCMNADVFARFLGLLGSIPFHNSAQNEHATPDTKYILKKKFDRGAYGEVWLAFNWNCSQVGKDTRRNREDKNIMDSNEDFEIHDDKSAYNCHSGHSDDNIFILKRIMVERGAAAYLSGLREKYFGELFLNASKSLRGSLSSGTSEFSWNSSLSKMYGFRNIRKSYHPDIKEPFGPEDMTPKGKRFPGVANEEGLNHIARYVESFESRSNEIWLVFRHEGVSLSKLLYTAEEVLMDVDELGNGHGKRVQILHPSKWWHWLKTTKEGQEEFRNIIWQLLVAIKSCHDRKITHRDIKPENMVICFEDWESGTCLRGSPDGDKNYTTKMRIIDFGSAVNDFTMKHFYGSVGPSSAEQTAGYAPPEALLNVSWYQGPSCVTEKYDMWSVGVVILELILGSPNVFQINSVTQVLLDQHLRGWNDNLKDLAYKLRALMELCILVPGTSKVHHNSGANGQGSASPVPWKCSEDHFSYLIKSRDPLKLGFPNIWALRLVRDLLRWDPFIGILMGPLSSSSVQIKSRDKDTLQVDRLGVDDALRHPYFSRATSEKCTSKS